jgi:hypothetical protein
MFFLNTIVAMSYNGIMTNRHINPEEYTMDFTREITLELVRVTEAAALMSSRWMGKGDKISADAAATDAMRGM